MKTKIWFLSCVLIWSCGDKTDLPEGVLNQEQMVDVLLDIYVAQAKVSQQRSIKRDSSEVLYKYYQNYILQGKGSDTTTFYTSLTYYFEHPEAFDAINEIVLDSLNLRVERIKAQEEKDKKEREKKDGTDREKIKGDKDKRLLD